MKGSFRSTIALLTGVAFMVPFSAPAWAGDAPQAKADDGFGEILVTAQRRSERARDVPISITALSGTQLSNAGITDTSALSNVTPGLRMDKVGNFELPAIRGVTTTITGPGADPNVALYLDGVYQPEATVNTFDLPDVERVEVLKGPQGTLFGRNATAGAIQVFTKNPQFKTAGNFSLSYGSYNDLQAKAFVTTPLIDDKAAISVAAAIHKSDTYYTNVGGGAAHPEGIDGKLIRAKLLVTPSAGLKILLSGFYSDRRDNSGILGTPLNGNSAARALDPNAIIPTKPWEYASDVTPWQRSKVASFSGKIEAEIGNGTLTSLTSYSSFINKSILDADYGKETNGTFLNYAADTTNKAFSEELTYASHSSGPLNYSAGLFYIDGWGGWTPLGIRTSSLTANIVSRQDYTSWAAFGELYYHVTDALQVIVGGRFSHEKRDLLTTFDFTLADNPPLNFVADKAWDSFTPRVSLKYDLNSSSNVYFSFSEGFKSGVFNTTAFSLNPDNSLPIAKPEKLFAYEVGYKGRVADWLNLNAAFFYDDYQNPQGLYLVAGPGGVSQGVYGNAGGAKIYGAEFDANMRFNRHFDSRLGMSFLHTKYEGFANITVSRPSLASDGVSGNVDTSWDATGNSMIKAPQFTAYLTATYHADVAGGTLDLSGTAFHSSTMFYTFDHRISQKSWETYDARIAWTPANDRFTISAYGHNLSNKAVIAGTYVQVAGDGISYNPPRTWGLQLDVRY